MPCPYADGLLRAGRAVREVGAATGNKLMVSHLRLAFNGVPLGRAPGRALVQPSHRALQLFPGRGLARTLPAAVRSVQEDAEDEQPLKVVLSVAEGAEGGGKTLWMTVTLPGFDLPTSEVGALLVYPAHKKSGSECVKALPGEDLNSL